MEIKTKFSNKQEVYFVINGQDVVVIARVEKIHITILPDGNIDCVDTKYELLVINSPSGIINTQALVIKYEYELFSTVEEAIKEAESNMSELSRCIKSPYYFATNYLTITTKEGNIQKFTTRLTEEEFNKRFKETWGIIN